MQEKLKKYCDISYKMNKIKNDDLKQELSDILIELKKEAISKFKEESDIKNFLDNVINFNGYSYNNQILIYLQSPNTSYVASFKKFNDMGYKINKGEEGIKILVPSFFKLVKVTVNGIDEIKNYKNLTKEELRKYRDSNDNSVVLHEEVLSCFKIGTVFDISQTNMPTEKIQEELNPVLEDNSADDIIDIFIKAIYKDGYKVSFSNIKDNVKGYCDQQNKTIVLRNGLNNLMKLKVLVHEYAHAIAHMHLENNYQEYKENRNQYEIEAEGIAYVVCKFLGLDTSGYSINYLYSWSKEKDFIEIDKSLELIVKESSKIIENYQKMLSKEFVYLDEKRL
ncbi:MAG: ArdC-like ssDNA-binding domain-containing protein [Clostridia bacterium]|nr:ArdC-like ssDNA-binding domain-containing protein [Clostridia bacterium]